ncbi:MAG: ATP-binding cassette domain-containing protein [Phycisphaeraceae bacterium]
MTTPPTSAALAVEVQGLRVQRGQTGILRGIDCAVPAGSCAVILGPNGSGKTTLMRCLTGQMFATAGTVRVLGQTLGQTDVRALRRRIGLVNPTVDIAGFHHSGAVVDADLTALEAVVTGYFGTVGLYDRASTQQIGHAAHLLHEVGLSHRRELRYGLLSTGEQRRAMIARALVHQPELLILDEPTAGLDIAGREHVLATIELFLNQREHPTVLMTTHHVEEISPRTGQVILLRDGRVLAQGTPPEVITPERLTECFGCKVYVKRLHNRYWLEVLPEAWLDLIRSDAPPPS